MASPFVSVRNLTILLALVCVAVTAAICTGMAVSSGDNALDKTKDASARQLADTQASSDEALRTVRSGCDAAISQCFASGEASINQRTEELLSQVADLVEQGLNSNLGTVVKQADEHADVIKFQKPKSSVDSAEFLWSTRLQLWADFMRFRGQGLTASCTYLFSNKMIQLIESGTTVANGPDELHHIKFQYQCCGTGSTVVGTVRPGGEFNYTADPDFDGPERLPDGTFEPSSCRTGMISPKTGQPCNMRALEACREGALLNTNGVIDDGVCPFESWNVVEQTVTQLTQAFWPVERSTWSPLVAISGFMGVGCMHVFLDDNGGKMGMHWKAMDVRTFSSYLSTIRVGNQGSIYRLFIQIQWSWLADVLPLAQFQQQGDLFAVSHGNATTFVYEFRTDFGIMGYNQVTRPAVQASDPLIRGTARYVANANLTYAKLNGTVSLFAMDSNLSGGGWVEAVPGARVTTRAVYAPPVNETLQYINGRRDPADKDLPPLPGYVADGAQFFMIVRPLYFGDPASPDTIMWLTVIVDRQYVLGAIDERRAATQAEIKASNERVDQSVSAEKARVAAAIKQSNEEVDSDLETDRGILYGVIAGSAVLLMVMSVMFVARIVAPIERLETEMADVALMKLERIDDNAVPSSLSEVAKMQKSFKQMVKNLKEFRSYMPASVLMDDDEEEEEDAGEQKVESVLSSQDRHSSALSLSKKGSSMLEQSRVSTKHAKHGAGMQLSLNKRRVALLSVNIRDFGTAALKMSSDRLMDTISKFLAHLVSAVQEAKGVPDTFNADRFYASFGAVRVIASSKLQAVTAALHMQSQVATVEADIGRKVSAACAAGEVACGNTGTTSMRKFCCIGAPASLVHTLEAHNDKLQTALLIDNVMYGEIEPKLLCRLMFPAMSRRGWQKCAEVTGFKTVSEDEWMYQLEEGQKNDPNVLFNEGILQVMVGDFDGALERIARHAAQHGETEQHLLTTKLIADCKAKAS